MNRLLVTIILLAFYATSSAINFSGQISGNTTWTKANSPYIITGHCMVDSNATLTIEPGVEIQCNYNYHFYIDGNIIAIGTPTDSIIFKKSNLSYWIGLEFRATTNSKIATFKYCSLRDGTNLIYMTPKTDLHVSNCTFMNSWVGIEVTNKFYIQNNKFVACNNGIHNGGAWLNSEIANNEFSNCNIGINGGTKGIIRNNYFHHNSYGIRIEDQLAQSVVNNIFINNKTGISMTGGGVIDSLSNNIIAYNEVGIDLFTPKGSITHNTIKHNKWGAYVNAFHVYPCRMEYNCLDSNTNQVMLRGHYDIDLKNNYWGTTDSLVIESMTEDYDQLFSGGHLTFMPLITDPGNNCQSAGHLGPKPSNPTSVPNVSKTSNVIVYPNPAQQHITFKAATTFDNIVISNIDGRVMGIITEPGKETTVDISQYPAGILLYKILFDDGSTHTGKIMKQ